MDNTIHQINVYPVDSAVRFVNTCLLDSDLSLSYAVSRNQVLRVNSIFFSFSYSYILRKYTIIVTVEKKRNKTNRKSKPVQLTKLFTFYFGWNSFFGILSEFLHYKLFRRCNRVKEFSRSLQNVSKAVILR